MSVLVCAITFSAVIMERGAGFRGTRVERGKGGEESVVWRMSECFFCLLSSVSVSLTYDCESVSLVRSTTASLQRDRSTRILKENACASKWCTKYWWPQRYMYIYHNYYITKSGSHPCTAQAVTNLDFLSLRARPLLARKFAMLTNCPILLEQSKVTGMGRSFVNSWTLRKERKGWVN